MAGAKRLTLLASGAATLLLAAGCGGGGGGSSTSAAAGTSTATATSETTTAAATRLAKGEYVTAMKAIGRSLSTSLNSLGSATTPAKAATALTSVQSDLRAAADRIHAIAAPAAIESDHARLEKAVRDFADELGPVIRKLKAGKMAALSTVPTLKGLREIQNASTAIANRGYKIGG